MCRAEAPHLSRWQQKYGERGLTVLAINSDNDPPEKLKNYRRDKNLKQRILLRGNGVAMNTYSVRRFPTKYLVDRDGIIVKRTYGNKGHAEFEREIRRLLARKPAKTGASR